MVTVTIKRNDEEIAHFTSVRNSMIDLLTDIYRGKYKKYPNPQQGDILAIVMAEGEIHYKIEGRGLNMVE